jgi:hypothetical protein
MKSQHLRASLKETLISLLLPSKVSSFYSLKENESAELTSSNKTAPRRYSVFVWPQQSYTNEFLSSI